MFAFAALIWKWERFENVDIKHTLKTKTEAEWIHPELYHLQFLLILKMTKKNIWTQLSGACFDEIGDAINIALNQWWTIK